MSEPVRTGAPEDLEIKFTAEMIEAGEITLLGILGGSDLPWDFSAEELAKEVYLEMEYARRTGRVRY